MGMLDRLRGTPQERFARRVLTAMRDAGVASARYLPDQFAIEVRRDSAQAQPAIAYLGNIFRECERSGRNERRERIASFLSAVVFNPGAPTSWEEVAPLLRPLLRTVTFGAGMPASAPRPLRRPAWAYLAEFVVIDQPTSVMYVTEKQAQEWGVTESGIFDRARRNMGGLTRAEPDAGAAPGRRSLVRMVEDGDAYWASHLFVDGWLAAQQPRLGGPPLAFVPDTTGVLLVGRGPDDTPESLGKVFELVEQEFRDAARPISPMAFTVDDAGAVVPFLVPRDHPLYAVTHRTEVIIASSEYAAQAAHLETDAFVAACTSAQRPDGTAFTVASWAEGVDTLLPRADYVAFPSGAAEPFFVAWDDVAREVDLDPEPGVVPERYRLRGWPHPGVVERLRQVATTP
ncbi:hypothetical protein Dvina_11880 [Dactylosporangium vinaceum]|uniref:Uncharacterized protein n=1 Tax=Dactylosporangium vinaceum TaxID=53362 RepID=A0ABV5MFC2_9ACTN|nr:hypothetical protein [Dactylosporangium vinaceum]UAB98709.1 hypothetical protein Dvina_11880 [Dactylosporangium vinaceum]